MVNISKKSGSIGDFNGRANFSYRESKAAINIFSRSLAAQLKSDGFICIALSPGSVKTDMGGARAKLSPAENVTAMIKVIKELKRKDSGRFFNYTGEPIPW